MLGTSGLLYCCGHKDTEETVQHHRPLSPTCSRSAGTCLSQWEGVMGDPSTLPKDTVPVPSEHTWLWSCTSIVSLPSPLRCVIAGCGTFVVRTLYSGMLSNRRRNWHFLWVNFGSPDTKNSPFGLQNRHSSCGEFESCPHPSLSRQIWIRPNHPH